jgi:hypothetical protein
MNDDWSCVPVPVVPVCFLTSQSSLIIYVTIYILISYVLLRGNCIPQILIGIIGIGIALAVFTFSLPGPPTLSEIRISFGLFLFSFGVFRKNNTL